MSNNPILPPNQFSELFRIELPHGTCVGIRLPPFQTFDLKRCEQLHPEEVKTASGYGVKRQITYAGGRIALATVLGLHGTSREFIKNDVRGAPILPHGLRGSISHKDHLAVALVQPDAGWTVGIDIEELIAPQTDISADVLRPAELQLVNRLSGADRVQALITRFSMKEAIYKAIDPYVHRYVGFNEVELDVMEDGAANARFYLEKREGPFEVELHWRLIEDVVLTTARMRPRSHT